MVVTVTVSAADCQPRAVGAKDVNTVLGYTFPNHCPHIWRKMIYKSREKLQFKERFILNMGKTFDTSVLTKKAVKSTI